MRCSQRQGLPSTVRGAHARTNASLRSRSSGAAKLGCLASLESRLRHLPGRQDHGAPVQAEHARERSMDLGLHEPVRGRGRNRVASTPHVDPTSRVHPGLGSRACGRDPLGQVAGPVPARREAATTRYGVDPRPGAETEACLLVFNVLFSAATVPADGVNLVSQPGDWIVGSLPLSNGETVWVQARQAGISSDERKGIASVEREYQGFQVSGDRSAIDPWGIWITTSPQGPPLLVQFPLGRHHVQVTGDASSQA